MQYTQVNEIVDLVAARKEIVAIQDPVRFEDKTGNDAVASLTNSSSSSS